MSRKEYMQKYNAEYKSRPIAKYHDHKQRAARRGLSFSLTFDEWNDLWLPHWEDRGSEPQQKCMARFGDSGGYTTDNVFITTNFKNNQERNKNYPHERDEKGRFV